MFKKMEIYKDFKGLLLPLQFPALFRLNLWDHLGLAQSQIAPVKQ